jgi:hypothetical protein
VLCFFDKAEIKPFAPELVNTSVGKPNQYFLRFFVFLLWSFIHERRLKYRSKQYQD